MSALPLVPGLPPLVEEYLRWRVDVRDVSVRTAESDAADLKDFLRRAGISDPASVTVRDIDSYATRMGLDNLDRETRRRRLYTLKSFYDWMHSRGHVQAHPMADFRIPRRRTSEKSSIFSEAEVQKIIYGFKPPAPSRQPREPLHNFERRVPLQRLREQRDKALLAVVYGCALRADEPSFLERRDYCLEDGKPVLCVRIGKGSDEPVTFPLDQRDAALLDGYLLELDRSGIGRRSPALFPSLSFVKSKSERGIRRSELRLILDRRVRLAGIDRGRRRLSPHSLRASCATHLARAGMPLDQLQIFMRHRSANTTMAYIRMGSRRAIGLRAIALRPWNRHRLQGAAPPPGRKRGSDE